MLKLE
jgi:hypothetical protein